MGEPYGMKFLPTNYSMVNLMLIPSLRCRAVSQYVSCFYLLLYRTLPDVCGGSIHTEFHNSQAVVYEYQNKEEVA